MGENNRLQILIPSGDSIVGKGAYQSQIELQDFWIDQISVTTSSYKEFLSKKKGLAPRYHDEYEMFWLEKKYEIFPVVFVSWGQAESYCEYYGGHLPTEAQWEKAARGTEGIILYWDDNETKAYNKANYDGFYSEKTPAGWLIRGAGPYGVLDMAGNVREWCLDWLVTDDQPVNTNDWKEIRDMKIKNQGRILKGGSFVDDVSHLRLFNRDFHVPNSPGNNRGFRCVYEK